MSEQIPAGWYPDPKDTTSDPRPQRWWDGKGWTADTRPAPSDAPPEPVAPAAPGPDETAETRVLEGEVLGSGPTVRYPEPPPFGAAYGAIAPPAPTTRRRPSKLVIAATVAALLGLGAGSGITYLAMDGHGEPRATHRTSRQAPPIGEEGPWGGLPDLGGPGNDGGQGGNGGSGQGNGNGNGNGNGGKGNGQGRGNGGSGQGNGGQGNGGQGNGGNDGTSQGSDTAADLVNRITLPVPSGWQGGTTPDGFAALSVGAYTCDGGGSCSLGGANTGVVAGGTDVQAAAKADIEKAAKDSYNDLNSHQELKSEAVKVDGRDGYLVRWKVDAAKGNDGYVQTVVFPSTDGKSLISVHLGFDIADKAPDVAVMDTIVKGIAAYTGKLPAFPGGGAGPGGGTGTATT
ncbi:DUF2510 domain-containing protein [Kitasatospora sp. NPDC005748]|uniref:DUF2510 domain-containing protein n=1 Tax=Kitasatospora sp. NPDC005748 TaxID=3157063 RepID=UPI0033FCE7E8